MSKFEQILKPRINKTALGYLTSRQGIKGGEMSYSDIEMSEYLTPTVEMSILEKRNMFSVKKRMINISSNFSSNQNSENCRCGESENMEHLYICKLLNTEKIEVEYTQLFNGSINEQITVYKRFQKNFEERERQRNEIKQEHFPHANATCEPQSSGIEHCNGFNK